MAGQAITTAIMATTIVIITITMIMVIITIHTIITTIIIIPPAIPLQETLTGGLLRAPQVTVTPIPIRDPAQIQLVRAQLATEMTQAGEIQEGEMRVMEITATAAIQEIMEMHTITVITGMEAIVQEEEIPEGEIQAMGIMAAVGIPGITEMHTITETQEIAATVETRVIAGPTETAITGTGETAATLIAAVKPVPGHPVAAVSRQTSITGKEAAVVIPGMPAPVVPGHSPRAPDPALAEPPSNHQEVLQRVSRLAAPLHEVHHPKAPNLQVLPQSHHLHPKNPESDAKMDVLRS